MIKAVFFDLDGTLLDTIKTIQNSGNFALSKLNLPLHDEESYRTFIGDGLKILVKRMLANHYSENKAQEACHFFTQYYSENPTKNTKIFHGINQLLNKLKSEGYQLGVVTNKAENEAKLVIEAMFNNKFTIVKGIGANDLPKPNPKIIQDIIKPLHIKAEELLYVGDLFVDKQTANNVGCHFCFVSWGYGKQFDTEYIIDKPIELLETIEKINGVK